MGSNTQPTKEEMAFGYMECSTTWNVVGTKSLRTMKFPSISRSPSSLEWTAMRIQPSWSQHCLTTSVVQYTLWTSAVIQPADNNDSDLPELHSKSEQINNITDLSGYLGASNPLS